ncbi:MAG: glycosyltransferase family 87 protein [Gemmataceae bacterium]
MSDACDSTGHHFAKSSPGWATHVRRLAIVLWVGLTIVCAARAVMSPRSHSVYPIYSYAAGEWLAGRDIYVQVPEFDFYRYSPTVAAFFSLWQPLGDGWGGAVWRVLGTILLASGLLAWARDVLPKSLAPHYVALLLLIVWPLLLQNLNNGQANTHVCGLLLWATADVSRGRLWRSAIAFAVAVLVKPYVLALVGLVAIIEPRLAWRFALALAVGLGLPFLLQSPPCVARQYAGWVHHFAENDRSSGEIRNAYRDLQMLFRVYAVPLSHSVYQIIELVAGLGMAVVIFVGRMAGRTRRELLHIAFALAACWMTVLGPATESCTYLLLGPTAAAAVVCHPGLAGRWARLACGLLIGVVAASMFPQDWSVQVMGPQPVAGLIILAVTVRECANWRAGAARTTMDRAAA